MIGFLNFDGNDDGNNNTRYGTIEAFIADNTGGTEDGRLTFSTMVAGSDTETMHIMGGSVGIGAAPSAPLDIHTANSSGTALRIISGNNLQFLNAANNTNANIYNNGATGESELAFQISGSTKVTIDNGGNVGIGTTTPNARLKVITSSTDVAIFQSTNATTTNFYISNSNATANNTANLYFGPANGVNGALIQAIAIEDFSTSAYRTADLAFQTRKDGTFAEHMRIDSVSYTHLTLPTIYSV